MIQDLGPLNFFLNIKAHRESDTLSLSQGNYVEQTLQRFRMNDCYPSVTPLDANQKLSTSSQENEIISPGSRNFSYQEAVGTILYMSQTIRPDLYYAACALSMYKDTPSPTHIKAVKRTLKYLQGTKNMSLQFKRSNNYTLVGYCHADFANNQQDRKCISRYVFLFMGAAISWCTKKQRTVSISSCEAEYIYL